MQNVSPDNSVVLCVDQPHLVISNSLLQGVEPAVEELVHVAHHAVGKEAQERKQ